MYAVILAGGGGTRLHPLSTPSAPSPSCRWSTSGRSSRRRSTGWRGLTDDITVVTDRPLRASSSATRRRMSALVLEPTGPQHRSGDRARRAAIDRRRRRGHGGAAGRPDDRATRSVFRDVLRTAAEHLATGAFGIEEPLVTLGVAGRPAGDRVRLSDPGREAGDDRRRRVRPTRSSASRRSRSPPARRSCPTRTASPGTRASSCGGAGRSSTRSAGTPGCSSRSAR